ncbi:hypothetical protein DFH27DRAFT_653130 [Peziza echinospora]|nr:hypothetical protein DFH27DRAFT_653130 [Peziza echinospora]
MPPKKKAPPAAHVASEVAEVSPTQDELDNLDAAMAQCNLSEVEAPVVAPPTPRFPTPSPSAPSPAANAIAPKPADVIPTRTLRSGKVYQAASRKATPAQTPPPTLHTSSLPESSLAVGGSPSGLSSLESLLLTVPQAGEIILDNLRFIHLTLLAASSRSLWYFIYTHPTLWQTFNLRPLTSSTLLKLRTRLPYPLTNRGQDPRTAFLAERLLREFSTEGDVQYILGRGNGMSQTALAGEVSWRMLKRLVDLGTLPKHVILDREWLAHFELQHALLRLIASAHGLEKLEIIFSPPMDAELRGSKKHRAEEKSVKVGRHFTMLHNFMKAVVDKLPAGSPGLRNLLIHCDPSNILPQMDDPALLIAIQRLTEIIVLCKKSGIHLNLDICNSCAPDTTAEEILAMIASAPPPPYTAKKNNPVRFWQEGVGKNMEFGEIPEEGGRICEACGVFDKEAACEGCLGKRVCIDCAAYQCHECIQIPKTAESSEVNQHGTYKCNRCHLDRDDTNILSCAACGIFENISNTLLSFCYLCKTWKCRSCDENEHCAQRENCNICKRMEYETDSPECCEDCGRHESRSCENCLNGVCASCRATSPLFEKTNKLHFRPGVWQHREARASMPQGSMMPLECARMRRM